VSCSVAAITCRTVRRPLRSPFRTALRELRELEAVEVELRWSDGSTTASAVSPTPPITGETSASIAAAVAGPLADAVRGVPLDAHEDLLRRLHTAIMANTTAKCAVDLAVHDALAAPVGGLPALLGARPRPLRTDVTVSLDAPAVMAEAAAARVADGFDVLKIKLGGDPDSDLRRVVAVHDAAGGRAALRLDANQAWTAKAALAVLDGLERAGIAVEMVEQPVAARDLAGMAAVTRHGPVAVLADESVHSARDVLVVAEAGAADLVNLKLAKCGGLRAARDVLATAGACGLGVVVGCMLEPGRAVAAAAAVALTLPEGPAHDLDAAWLAADEAWVRCRPPQVLLAPDRRSTSQEPTSSQKCQ
jgi:L-alanine-DL-glutamate epimerase-like enolase superfamily enzyme